MRSRSACHTCFAFVTASGSARFWSFLACRLCCCSFICSTVDMCDMSFFRHGHDVLDVIEGMVTVRHEVHALPSGVPSVHCSHLPPCVTC